MEDSRTEEQLLGLRRHFESMQSKLISLIRQLVEIESPSGHEAGSRHIARVLEGVARGVSCFSSINLIESPGYGVHFLARAFSEKRSHGSILVLGHTDTVHELETLSARPCREDGSRIYAPGIFDMKAGCALAIHVIEALCALDLKPSREIVLLLTCDEETGSGNGRALVESEGAHSDFCLVLEPPASEGRAKTSRKGTGIFRLTVKGRAAHAGLEPEKGINAIHEIAKQIGRLGDLADPESETTVNVGRIRGGTRVNVIAEEAEADVDVRFSTAEEAERIERAIRALRPFDERAELFVSGGINRPPLERTEAVANLYGRAREVASVLGFELGEASVGGASDGNFVAALGVPVLDGLGVEGDGAHARHEHIEVANIARRASFLAGLLLSL